MNNSTKKYLDKNSISSNLIFSKNNILDLKIFHNFLDSLNISLIILVSILSFLSLKSQEEWTNLYSSLIELRSLNNNLIDYISNTEEYFLKKIEFMDNIKNASPNDLIYVSKSVDDEHKSFLVINFEEIIKGFKDSKYQRGY